jgi:hypothetical protein
MLKTLFLASSMLVAVPAFAQDAKPAETIPPTEQTEPADQAATPVAGEATAAQPAPQSTPAPVTETAQPTPSVAPAEQPADLASQPSAPETPEAAPAQPAETAAAQPAPAPAQQPAANEGQVAEAVTRDFGTYDKDANGALSQAEFGSWMSTLRKASEPAFKPGTPEATSWEQQAFTAADADKNASVNQSELTTFLTPKPS